MMFPYVSEPPPAQCGDWRVGGTQQGHHMSLSLSPLTEGSKSTLVMLPAAPSRVWLASRRPGGTGKKTGEMKSLTS